MWFGNHKWFLSIVVFLATISVAFADGSRDLYPAGVTGGRARLVSHRVSGMTEAWSFPTTGVHYVYAKAGETIAMASSAQGVGFENLGRLILYDPNGNIIVNHITPTSGAGADIGKIANRNQELAGPAMPGSLPVNGQYIPVYYKVTEEGIYKVEMYSTRSIDNASLVGRQNILADENWVQFDYSSFIAAWDVSVANTTNTEWIKGRVFANVLNLDIFNNFQKPYCFYGVFYVLTNDGFTYRVNNNGNNGVSFAFFVNNKGFLDGNEPLYKSILIYDVANKVHDPRLPDTESSVTHKIFYTLPADDLPSYSKSELGNWWLKNPRIESEITDAAVIGVDGTVGQLGSKGGYVSFNSSYTGRYTISISSPTNSFQERIIEGYTKIGENKVYWDGKSGNGQPLPDGIIPARIVIQLRGAEVHFPYLDTEINPQGIKVELLAADNVNVQSNVVYWDDSDLPMNGPVESRPSPVAATEAIVPGGTNSAVNGHKFGQYLTVSTAPNSGNGNSGIGMNDFGNDMAIDTWTYVLGDTEIITVDIWVRVADLEVKSVVTSADIVKTGEQLKYTVELHNAGPDHAVTNSNAAAGPITQGAIFTFQLPEGIITQHITFTSTAANAFLSQGSFNPETGVYKAIADLPAGESITVVFDTEVTDDLFMGNVEAWAAILRPNDITDPDATNPDPDIPPTDAYYECSQYDSSSGNPIPCNNIKFAKVYNSSKAVIDLVKTVMNTGSGQNGSFKPGDEIEYIFTVKNKGDFVLKNPVLTDPLPDITVNYIQGDNNYNNLLDIHEVWQYKGVYTVKDEDALAMKVINQAKITAFAGKVEISDLSGTAEGLDNETVVPVYIAPVAVDDDAVTDINKSVVINILTNDKAGNSKINVNSVQIIDQPLNGTLTIVSGLVTYTPHTDYYGTDNFTYQLQDEEGNWSNIATVTVKIIPFLFIPNVITPNGDGVNDHFEILGLERYDYAEITIINRWGSEVFKSGNYQNNWDGQTLNAGTYYYYLILTKAGIRETYKGWILVKK